MRIYKIILIFLVVILAGCSSKNSIEKAKSFSPAFDVTYNPCADNPYVPKEWLIKKVSFDEVEKKWKKHKGWQRLKPLLLKGDEMWLFNSPKEYWKRMAGRKGYAIVREGQPIGGFLTSLN